MMHLILLTLMVGAEPRPTLPAWNLDVQASAKHIATVPVHDQPHIRYVMDSAWEQTFERTFATTFGINLTSRKPLIAKFHRVTDTCYWIDITDWGWDAKTWENLNKGKEPYLTQYDDREQIIETTKKIKKKVPVQYGYKDKYGRWHDTRIVYEEKEVEEKTTEKVVQKGGVAARWVDPIAIAQLQKYTGSKIPVVRLDWLLWMQSGQRDRLGAGYYDFLRIKKLKEWEALVGLVRKVAIERGSERRAIIEESGVTLLSRQIEVLDSVGGMTWLSLDVFERATIAERRLKDAVLNLDGKYVADAFEGFGPLPNGLWSTSASNAAGDLQEFVPANIASDHFGKGNRVEIEPNMSCLRCHTNGIQELDDYARKTFAGFEKTKWKHHNKEKLDRLKQLYLAELQSKVKEANDKYLTVVKRFGFKSAAEAHAAYVKVIEDYAHKKLDAAQVARELGVPKDLLIEAIKKSDGGRGRLPSLPISRKRFEERFEEFMKVVGF